MNSFAYIKKVDELSCKIVTYYSVCLEGNEETEFIDFLNRMDEIPEIEEDLTNLYVWIEEIGNQYGAQKKFFRNESIDADTYALPPPKGIMRTHEIEVNDIRLYCFVANEHVVFLFNGGIKTQGIIDAKKCPNVGKYIKQANNLSKAIDKLFKDNEIQWNKQGNDILFDPELELQF